MDKLVNDIMVLNQVYSSMRKNIVILKKMFPSTCNINQKLVLTEQLLNQIYVCISDKLQSEENLKQFNDIIKSIKEDKNE